MAKYYIPATGGPYPWTVLGAIQINTETRPQHPAFESYKEAIEWAEKRVDQLNKEHEKSLA